ncbi:MAG: hypothetical protein C4538_09165 [Nitrospiraceae bacterium]|nr:MAG: hypothetical protein C4538_09165 [Nitrospiraceae bacterium]
MEITFEQIGKVGIFNFSGQLTGEHEDKLKIALMRAIHSIDRAVLNFQKVTQIDRTCLQLLKEAYFTSVRLSNPLILLHLHENYLKKVSGLNSEVNADYIFGRENGNDNISTEAAYK